MAHTEHLPIYKAAYDLCLSMLSRSCGSFRATRQRLPWASELPHVGQPLPPLAAE